MVTVSVLCWYALVVSHTSVALESKAGLVEEEGGCTITIHHRGRRKKSITFTLAAAMLPDEAEVENEFDSLGEEPAVPQEFQQEYLPAISNQSELSDVPGLALGKRRLDVVGTDVEAATNDNLSALPLPPPTPRLAPAALPPSVPSGAEYNLGPANWMLASAVQRDNAGEYSIALEKYGRACQLFTPALGSVHNPNIRRSLEELLEPYTSRMAEIEAAIVSESSGRLVDSSRVSPCSITHIPILRGRIQASLWKDDSLFKLPTAPVSADRRDSALRGAFRSEESVSELERTVQDEPIAEDVSLAAAPPIRRAATPVPGVEDVYACMHPKAGLTKYLTADSICPNAQHAEMPEYMLWADRACYSVEQNPCKDFDRGMAGRHARVNEWTQPDWMKRTF